MSAKQIATKRIVERSNGVVQWGPFRGMTILPHASWGDGDVGARLLGVYEQELHDVFDAVRAPSTVINVGCAEGYYAVGLARRLSCPVWAVDIDAKALQVTQDNARANGVVVEVMSELPDSVPADAFWVVDVEGDEGRILNPAVIPELLSAEILVELHPWKVSNIYSILVDRFADTHSIVEIVQGDRSVNQFSMLADLTDEQRWSVASEGRPQLMRWLWMRPLG